MWSDGADKGELRHDASWTGPHRLTHHGVDKGECRQDASQIGPHKLRHHGSDKGEQDMMQVR